MSATAGPLGAWLASLAGAPGPGSADSKLGCRCGRRAGGGRQRIFVGHGDGALDNVAQLADVPGQ